MNVWIRGEPFYSLASTALTLVKQLAPWCLPASAVADSFCMFCGVGLQCDDSRWEAKAHSEGCPFWREAAKFDIPKLRAQGQKLKMTVQRCEFEFKLSNSL